MKIFWSAIQLIALLIGLIVDIVALYTLFNTPTVEINIASAELVINVTRFGLGVYTLIIWGLIVVSLITVFNVDLALVWVAFAIIYAIVLVIWDMLPGIHLESDLPYGVILELFRNWSFIGGFLFVFCSFVLSILVWVIMIFFIIQIYESISYS